MRYRYTILLLAIGLVAGLAGCSSPGRSVAAGCDPVKGLDGLADKANVAGSDGGMKLKQAPDQKDTRFKPMLTFAAGQGPATSTDESQNRKRLLNAGNQLTGQFLYAPTEAAAGDGSGGPTAAELGLLHSLDSCHCHMEEAIKASDGKAYELLTKREASILKQLAMCGVTARKHRPSVEVTLEGAKSTNLPVAHNSADGEAPSDAAVAARGKAIEAGAKAAVKISEADSAEYEATPSKDADPKADDPDAPPAGPGGDTDGE